VTQVLDRTADANLMSLRACRANGAGRFDVHWNHPLTSGKMLALHQFLSVSNIARDAFDILTK